MTRTHFVENANASATSFHTIDGTDFRFTAKFDTVRQNYRVTAAKKDKYGMYQLIGESRLASAGLSALGHAEYYREYCGY